MEHLALILSDLHLGEEDSLFMSFDPNEGVNRSYLEALRDFLFRHLESSSVRYLILLGDAVDLSLAKRKEAFLALKEFFEVFQDLFQETVIYLPGNHDHHLWCAFQEEALVFQKIRTNRPIEPYYHAFCPRLEGGELHLPKKVSQPLGKKTFIYHLLPEKAQKEDKGFLMAYPNLYVSLPSDIHLLLTHGHFFEEAWTLFTDIFRKSLAIKKLNFKALERINSPFIEFGWYSLGQAGELSKLLEKLWDELHEGSEGPVTKKALADLMSYLDEKISFKPHHDHHGFWGHLKNLFSQAAGWTLEAGSDLFLKLCVEETIKHLLVHLVPKSEQKPGSSLRHASKILSEERTRKRVEAYLEMALPVFPEINTLVFGHTHVPFIDGSLHLEAPGGPRIIRCFNTGGWVTDLYEATHLSLSKPLVIALNEKGLRPLHLPWPSYEEFEELLENTPEDKKKEEVKKLIWGKLL